MALFRKQPTASAMSRQALEAKYNGARINLLLAVILTTVNIVFLLTRDFSYFLFSASIPYMLVDFGMVLCGKYPPEYYEGEIADMAFFGDGLLITLSVIAFLIVGVYLALWYFSRRHKNCLTAALILFIIDTVILLALLNPSLSGLLDLLTPPATSYTMSASGGGSTKTTNTTKTSVSVSGDVGRPKEETSDMSDAKEKAVDAGEREV